MTAGSNNSFRKSDRARFRFASSGCRPLSGECTAWTTPSSVRQRPLLRGGRGDCPVTIRLLGLLRLPLRRAGCMLAAAARIIVTNMNGDAPSRCGRQVNPPARAARRRRRKRPRGSRGWWARRPPRSSAPRSSFLRDSKSAGREVARKERFVSASRRRHRITSRLIAESPVEGPPKHTLKDRRTALWHRPALAVPGVQPRHVGVGGKAGRRRGRQ